MILSAHLHCWLSSFPSCLQVPCDIVCTFRLLTQQFPFLSAGTLWYCLYIYTADSAVSPPVCRYPVILSAHLDCRLSSFPSCLQVPCDIVCTFTLLTQQFPLLSAGTLWYCLHIYTADSAVSPPVCRYPVILSAHLHCWLSSFPSCLQVPCDIVCTFRLLTQQFPLLSAGTLWYCLYIYTADSAVSPPVCRYPVILSAHLDCRLSSFPSCLQVPCDIVCTFRLLTPQFPLLSAGTLWYCLYI